MSNFLYSNPTIMPQNFNQYAADGNQFLKELATELNLTNEPEKVYRILAAILHALRDVISTEESIQLISQFPMFLKAVYVNRWDTHQKKQKIKTTENFIELIKEKCGTTAKVDFPDDEKTELYLSVTFIVLRKYISFGELEDLKSNLPKDLKWIVGGTLMF